MRPHRKSHTDLNEQHGCILLDMRSRFSLTSFIDFRQLAVKVSSLGTLTGRDCTQADLESSVAVPKAAGTTLIRHGRLDSQTLLCPQSSHSQQKQSTDPVNQRSSRACESM